MRAKLMNDIDKNLYFMQEAMKCASNSLFENEVPVGAVIVKNNLIVGRGWNRVIQENRVTSHAEINAIIDASKNLKNYRLVDCNLFVTLEPCHMCAKAIVNARMKNVFFATSEPNAGAIISADNFFEKSFLNHKVNYSEGLMKKESSELLRNFFKKRRIL